MVIGYARVSSDEQSLGLQLEALKKAGCEKIFEEKVSGVSEDRPQLEEMLMKVNQGDTVLVWRLDRLGRSAIDVVFYVSTLIKVKKAHFKSLIERRIDSTRYPIKDNFLNIVIQSFISEGERDANLDRIRAGIELARSKRKHLGRPKGFSKEQEFNMDVVVALYKEGRSVREIAKQLKIGKSTAYRYLSYKGVSCQGGLQNGKG